jgi:hypothetical protein
MKNLYNSKFIKKKLANKFNKKQWRQENKIYEH